MQSSIVTRLSFGFVVSPQATDTLARFEELAGWLRENVKIELVSRPAPTYKELVDSVREGTSDLAWLPPVAYAWLAEAVTPLGSILREGATTYAAAVVVREDSELHALKDLSKVRAGWVDPWSAAGYVVPRLELARAGIRPHDAFSAESFHGSHREALHALRRGECDVVGTYARDADEGEAPVGAWSEMEDLQVRVLARFGSIPPDVIAARRNLLPREYEHAVRTFHEACKDDTGRALVRAIFGGEALREGIERGHSKLRRAYETGIANGLFD